MHPFQDACGATGPLVLTVDEPGNAAGQSYVFEQPFVLIGRDPRCDLQLDHHEVSDRHAYLQLVGGRLVCLDLGSRNGVHYGGRRSRVFDLDRDRPVRIGPYRIRLVAGDANPGDPPRPEVLDATPGPQPLELAHRLIRKSRIELPPGLALVGSGDCPIRLVDPSVSVYHASLVRTATGVWVVDLLGEGGVRLNGEAVNFAALAPGDAIELGHSSVRLLVVEEESITPITPPPVDAPARRATDAPVAAVASPSVGSELPAAQPIAQAADIVERVLTPVVNQMGLIQQQMIDEFRQARETIVDTFTTLYQEQSSFLNQELEQLRLLSQDLHMLRVDLERQTQALGQQLGSGNPSVVPAPHNGIPSSGSSASTPARLGSAALTGPRAPSAGQRKTRNGTTNGRSTILSEAGAPEPLFGNRGNGAGPQSVRTRETRGPGRDPAHEIGFHLRLSETSATTEPATPAPAPSSPKTTQNVGPAPRPASNGSDVDIHTQLCERIARIKDENQSRWQRLLGLFQNDPGRATSD
ncbi:MAG: FHA domain-containing protein [Isosphaeraceae bacterium]